MQEQILDALRRGDTEAALDTARALAAGAPGDADAQRLLALALRAGGDVQAARDAITAAIALAPDNPELHMEHASLQFALRDVDAAQQALQATVALDPNHFTAYVTQAHLALARGNPAEAERLVRLAERVQPEHPALQALEGMIELRRGNGAAAIAKLSTAAQRMPDDPLALQSLAFAHFQEGHFAFAEQAFRKVMELAPPGHDARLMVALLQERQGRPLDALDELAPLSIEAAKLLEESLRAGRLSGRGLHRVRRLALTLADRDSFSGRLSEGHVALALQLRPQSEGQRVARNAPTVESSGRGPPSVAGVYGDAFVIRRSVVQWLGGVEARCAQ